MAGRGGTEIEILLQFFEKALFSGEKIPKVQSIKKRYLSQYIL